MRFHIYHEHIAHPSYQRPYPNILRAATASVLDFEAKAIAENFQGQASQPYVYARVNLRDCIFIL